MSRFLTRLVATAAVLAIGLAMPIVAAADSPADATWAPLAALPEKLDSPVFGLTADPTDSRLILAGTGSGSLYRSADGGATWTAVRRDLGRGVLAIAFNPFKPGQVLMGTRSGGIWRSGDGGQTWAVQPGTERLSVRAFGFAKSLVAAGTDHGVMTSRLDAAWAPAGLDQVSVGSVALSAVNDPPRLLAGGDASRGSEALPLFQSADGGASWNPLTGPSSGSSMVASLTAGPLGNRPDVRPLLMGTNTGVFVSIDGGSAWQQLSGGGTLPNTDFSQVAFAGASRFYVASDGGGSDRGGLWSTVDGGQHFASLNPPIPSVTSLSLSLDGDVPVLYGATFRPADHAVQVWRLRDTGQPVTAGAAPAPPIAASPQAAAASPVARSGRALGGAVAIQLLTGPEAPFLATGLAAVIVVMIAGVAYLRRGRS